MVIAAFSPADPIFIGDIFGLLLALPISLFLAFWLSSVKNRAAVVIGAFVAAFLSFLFILLWTSTILRSQPLDGANGGSVFFGSLLFCLIAGLVGGIATDLVIARLNERDYRRQVSHE